MDFHGESKTLIHLTLQKLAIIAGSMGHLACKGLKLITNFHLKTEDDQ